MRFLGSRLARVLTLLIPVLAASACDSRPDERPGVAIFNLLSHPILDASVAGIKIGLAEGGYPAESVALLELNANGDVNALDAMAREILATGPAIIVPVSTPVATAVIQAAPASQQIVYSTVTNPSDIGMDARPPNVTGVSDAVNYRANLELIRRLFPEAQTVGMAYNPGEANSAFGVERVKELAPALGMELITVSVANSGEVMDAVNALLASADVIYVGSDNTVVSAIAAVTESAYERGVPVIASDVGSVEGGALAAVSVDYEALGIEVGRIVAALLDSGGSASTVEPVRFEGDALILNLQAAERIGYAFPDSLVGQATRVVRSQ